jgi:predicted nucleic acid-binding protein
MIVYLDTSSLVKVYVEEEGSPGVAEVIDRSMVAATSIVTYAESRAAFARRMREGAFTNRDYKKLILNFERDWINYMQVKVSQELIQLAGNLAEKHALRGFDAIHLASALMLKKSGVPVIFSCYDEKLQRASSLEKLVQPIG